MGDGLFGSDEVVHIRVLDRIAGEKVVCIAIPSKIIKIEGDTAEVDVAGNRRQANVSLLPDIQVGDYVLIHAGFAISKWCEEEARESLKLFKELGDVLAQEDRS